MNSNRGFIRELKQWLKRLFGVVSDREDFEWKFRQAIREAKI